MHSAAWLAPREVRAGRDMQFLSFRYLLGLTREEELGDDAVGMEVGVVLVEGEAEVSRDGFRAVLGPRPDPRQSLPDSVYLPPGGPVRIVPRGKATVGVAFAQGGEGLAPRRIPPEEVVVEERGRGDTARTVRHILEAHQPAGRLLLVEVITPGGHWSSFPPHRHDRDVPEEGLLEETYAFRIWPAEHRALMGVWTDEGEAHGFVVGDGSLVAVRRGYHVVSASPGSTVYYLNAMAGPRRTWRPVFHPAYRHLVEGWERAPVSPAQLRTERG